MVNLKILAAVVVLMITAGATVILGTAILGGMGKSVRTTTVAELTDFNVSATSVISSSLSDYEYPQSLSGCIVTNNASQPYKYKSAVASSVYTIDEGFGETDGLLRLDTANYNLTTWNCTSLTYLEDSSSSGAADLFGAALIIFGTFMAILSLAIVGKTVLGIFQEE